MSYLTTEKKSAIFSDFGQAATNTGSIEAQIAMLTEKISHISKHLQANKKDFSTHRGLMQMVGRRNACSLTSANTTFNNTAACLNGLD